MAAGVMLIFIGWRACSHSMQVHYIPEVIKIVLLLDFSGKGCDCFAYLLASFYHFTSANAKGRAN